jgi:hypothetical protein
MKKKYITPGIDMYSVSPSMVLAGSLNPNDQSDPSLSPDFDTDDLQLFLSDDSDVFDYS